MINANKARKRMVGFAEQSVLSSLTSRVNHVLTVMVATALLFSNTTTQAQKAPCLPGEKQPNWQVGQTYRACPDCEELVVVSSDFLESGASMSMKAAMPNLFAAAINEIFDDDISEALYEATPELLAFLLPELDNVLVDAFKEIMVRESAAVATTYQPGDTFQDCPDCPEMVVIPSGTFMMGAPESEEESEDGERPVHQVTIAYPFAAGKYEVTFAEWYECVAAGGCSHKPKDFWSRWSRGRRPVVNVYWHDAQEYVRWLKMKTGYEYRLPSESEWEYMARAGTTTPFHTGQSITPEQANFDGEYSYRSYPGKGLDRSRTVEVGSFAANAFGLHDMHGNVNEWVQDCWDGLAEINGDYVMTGYMGAPVDGSAWESDDCFSRVLRGGAYDSKPGELRSAKRSWFYPYMRGSYLGFRVVRTLTP